MININIITKREVKYNIGMEDFTIPAETKGRVIDLLIEEDETVMFLCEFESMGIIEWLTAQDIITER